MAMPDHRVAVIIEDDADIRNLLEAILAQAGFETHAFEDGSEGVAAVKEHQPILTTLDISLPGIDGFEVARQIRHFSDTYIIILSARTEEVDTLMGLDAGADDYLTKPFRPRELRARVEAMMRRRNTYSPETPVAVETRSAESPTSGPAPVPADPGEDDGWLSHNGLRIHPEMRLCELDGEPVTLTRSEFDLLQAIMNGKRRVVSKDTLSLELRGDQTTGGYVSESDRRAVEVHLANVRRKLNDPVNAPRFIETVRGVGYRLANRQS